MPQTHEKGKAENKIRKGIWRNGWRIWREGRKWNL